MTTITLQEYANKINDNPDHPLNKENSFKKLHEYEQLLINLELKKIKPSSIIGTGYKYPKKSAIDWLNKCIVEYHEIVNGTRINPIIKANYEHMIRGN